jgi:hypothetical protein
MKVDKLISMKKSDFYYAINSDLTLKEFDQPRKMDFVMFWIKKTDTGRIHRTAMTGGKNEFHIFSYQILNPDLTETNIIVGNCKIINVYEENEKHSYKGTYFKISDRNGEIKNVQFHHDCSPSFHHDPARGIISDERAIICAIMFLKDMAMKNFDCWHTFKLYYENIKLKSELDKLRSLIQK